MGRSLKLKLCMSVFVVTAVWILLWGGSLQAPAISEKQAVASAQRILASGLDAELPSNPFADWFRQMVGPQAGVNWQLSECGERPSMLVAQGRSVPACAEVNALLPDGRKVVVMIEVGTFEKGIAGNPSFSHAAIEQEGELYPVRRLRDLPQGLSGPAALKDRYSVKFVALNANLRWLSQGENGGKALHGASADETAPPPPAARPTGTPGARPTGTPAAQSTGTPGARPTGTPAAQPTGTPAAQPTPAPQETRKISEGVVRGNAIVKVEPLYPASAKKMQAAGSVQVQVTISEEGRVIEATTVSGHPLLRNSAVDAARKWVFKRTMLNGVPVRVQSTLTFVFTLTQ